MRQSALTIAEDWPRPAKVLEYYQRSIEAIAALRQAAGQLGPVSRFYGMTAVEVDQAIRELVAELEHEVTMMLTASFEAALQVDFYDRVSRKKKDQASRKLRQLAYRPLKGRPRGVRTTRIVVEEILDVWMEQTGRKQLIGNLKQLFQFRHWLAHGRYWVQRSGLSNPDPFDAWSRGKAVFDALPDFDSAMLS